MSANWTFKLPFHWDENSSKKDGTGTKYSKWTQLNIYWMTVKYTFNEFLYGKNILFEEFDMQMCEVVLST